MQTSVCFIGVDVGKFELQVAGHEGQIVAGVLPNNRSSIVLFFTSPSPRDS